MKKYSILCLLISLLSLFLPSLSLAQPQLQGLEKALEETASQLEKGFPPVELYVIALQEGKIVLENSKEAELVPGMELSLFREGKEFTHPITGVVLGRFEESLGAVRISEVKEDYCLAQIIKLEPGVEVKRGDKARITAGRIKLALLRVVNRSSQAIDEEALTQHLVYELEDSERFEIIPSGELLVVLDKLSIAKDVVDLSKEQLQQLGAALGVQVVLAAQLKELGKITILDSKAFSTTSGMVITKTSEQIQAPAPPVRKRKRNRKRGMVVPMQDKAGPGFIIKRKAAPELEEGVFKGEQWDFAIKALGCGDVNGDGKKELVVTDGKQVRIYAFADQSFTLLWTEAKDVHKHFTLEVADINQNGKAEIFVTDYPSAGLKSYVLEYNGQDYVSIAEWNRYFLRLLYPSSSQQPQLIGQKLGTSSAFYGPVEILAWQKDKYAPVKSLDLPAGVNIYGFAQGDVNNDGQAEIIYIDDYDHLRVYSQEGEPLWKSSEYYGGYDLFFHHRPKSAITTVPSYVPGDRITIKGRIFVRDLDKNGVNEILIVRNISSVGKYFPNTTAYGQGQIVDLEWDGIGYSEAWQTKKLEAYIADFLLEDLDGDGRQELIMALVLSRGWDKLFDGEKKSLILFYRL